MRDIAKIRAGLIVLSAMAALCSPAAPSLAQGSSLAALDKLAEETRKGGISWEDLKAELGL